MATECKRVSQEIYTKYQSIEKVYAMMLEKISASFVQSNLAIKGEKINLNTIKVIQKEGFFMDDFDEKIGNQILSINEAFEKLFHIVYKSEIGEEQIAGLHKILQSRIVTKTAGMYVDKEAEEKMREYIEWFNNEKTLEDTEFVATAYQKYIYMHPFRGNNGVMARLMMNLACLRRKLSLIIIPAEEKEKYEIIINASKDCVTKELVDFIRECMLSSAKMLKSAQKEMYSDKKNRHLRGIDHTDLILNAIRENPGIRIMDLKKLVTNISFIKLQHLIKSLREQGLVEFRGALRNGGYFAL